MIDTAKELADSVAMICRICPIKNRCFDKPQVKKIIEDSVYTPIKEYWKMRERCIDKLREYYFINDAFRNMLEDIETFYKQYGKLIVPKDSVKELKEIINKYNEVIERKDQE